MNNIPQLLSPNFNPLNSKSFKPETGLTLFNKEENEESISQFLNRSLGEGLDQIENIETFIVPFKSSKEVFDNSILFANTYSFIQTYLSVLKTSKTIHTYPLILKFNLQVNIRDYSLSEDGLFNYVKYQIEGIYDKTEFCISRRYKEFLSFRQLLVQNWPGLLIHPIPPKKAFGNLDDSFINLRKKFLQQFFNNVSASPHLASAYETKVFLESRNENFLDLPIEIYVRPIKDIYKIYLNYFNFLAEKTLTQKEKAQVQNFYLMLTKTRNSLETLQYVITESKNSQIETQNLVQNFYEHCFLTENSFYDLFKVPTEVKENLNKSIIEVNLTETMYKTKFDNVFTTFFEWVNNELIDTDAMIEAISTLYKYNEIFEQDIIKLKMKNDELEKASSQSALQGFFFSLDLDDIQMKINEVKNLKEEIEVMKKLIDIIYKIIYFIEIPTFKRDQYTFNQAFLKKVIEDETHANDKNKTIYAVLKEHCKGHFELLKTMKEVYIEKNKDNQTIISNN